MKIKQLEWVTEWDGDLQDCWTAKTVNGHYRIINKERMRLQFVPGMLWAYAHDVSQFMFHIEPITAIEWLKRDAQKLHEAAIMEFIEK